MASEDRKGFHAILHSRLVFFGESINYFYIRRYCHMTNAELNAALYQKMFAEQEKLSGMAAFGQSIYDYGGVGI